MQKQHCTVAHCRPYRSPACGKKYRSMYNYYLAHKSFLSVNAGIHVQLDALTFPLFYGKVDTSGET